MYTTLEKEKRNLFIADDIFYEVQMHTSLIPLSVHLSRMVIVNFHFIDIMKTGASPFLLPSVKSTSMFQTALQ